MGLCNLEYYVLLFDEPILGRCNLECFVIVKGDVLGSIAKFDKAIELDPRQKACRLQGFIFIMHFV